MKQHLLDTFSFNDFANRKLIEKIKLLPDNSEAIKLFSHLIACQEKWFAKLTNDPNETTMNWWEPVYSVTELENAWTASVNKWNALLQSRSEEELSAETNFKGTGDVIMACAPADIVLHLNYHSIHHRAQILSQISKQGLAADVPDYIRTKIRRVDTL
jgi:uncharacterized damage-inducible protein DinB